MRSKDRLTGRKSHRTRTQRHPADVGVRVQLTHRQQQVLALVRIGLHRRTIADRLHVTPGTVRNHVHAILKKLLGEIASKRADDEKLHLKD